ncbi:MAG: alkane 1-monooxygenase [Woeseiaceae bacterium]
MKGYTGVLANGEAVYYMDRKRWMWLLSVAYPLQPFIAIWLHHRTGSELWFLVMLLSNYVVLPLLDWVIGQDTNNPPEEIVIQLDRDPYYRRLTYLVVPLHFVTLFGSAGYALTQPLSWWAFALLAILAGLTAGLAINTAHELGHKNSKFEKLLARAALAVAGYGHFCVEHNRGHHKHVSTPQDPASSRMGESIYRFAAREIPGAFRRAWQFEKERLAQRHKPLWHFSNPILQSYALTAAIGLVLIVLFGWRALPFLLIHNLFAYWQLTSANYVEHYGLLRDKDGSGRYERCQPHHSWNSNHILSNLVLFHLERHSDHHTHPLRRYQSLRHYENLPTLPNGYFGMYVLAYIPSLWFRVMDKRLMALPHVQGDPDRVNVDPRARSSICRTWGQPAAGEVPTTATPTQRS